jgi:hypothetical protein
MYGSVETWVRSKIYGRGVGWIGSERDMTVGDDAWQQPKREHLRRRVVWD